MGMVYRAHDRRLSRDVAVKVLPAAFSANADRVARFGREARLLATLSHPHIAAIYGFEETDNVQAIVLELVEGETLAERLMRGPIPVREALGIARQIAEALDAAHDKSIMHRDLKPANIKLTPDGTVKVLDFGLAKAFDEPAVPESPSSPTVSFDGTRPGAVLGTVGYMSPEQARGNPADKRTDIWAFGCVLYEMLTGRRVFAAATASDALAAVLNQEPDWNALPAATPEPIRTLLRRCLEKDRKQRLRDIGDAVLELQNPPATTTVEGREPRSRTQLWTAAVVVLFLLVVILVLAARPWVDGEVPVSPQASRLTVLLPPRVTVAQGPADPSSVALSPDGRLLVIAGLNDEGASLYVRRLDQLEATPLAGTAGGTGPFFSPDGKWIAFFAQGRLRRIPVAGGAALDIADVPLHTVGASWGPDDQIVLVWGARSPLHTVHMDGGTVKPITTLQKGEIGHNHPEVLPQGHNLLFDDGRWIHALDRASGRRVRLLEGTAARYVATGHLIFRRGTTLLGVPFDGSRLEITGSAVPLVEGVVRDSRHYAVARDGTLAYVPTARSHSLVLLKPDGTERVLAEEHLSLQNPQFSPDGRRLAVASSRRIGETLDIWLYDLESGASSRMTHDGGRAPVWSPDGSAVTYSRLKAPRGIYRQSVEDGGQAERLLALKDFHWLVGWTPDERTLVFGGFEERGDEGTSYSSILAVSDGKSRRVLGPGAIWGGRLSPDGRRIAYYLLEGGSYEVYVSPFPQGGTRWLISDRGGRDPSWGPDGKDLYYRSGDRLVAARLETGEGGRVSSRRVVLEPFRPPLYDDYDVHPDGRTLAFVRPTVDPAGQIVVAVNCIAELQRLLQKPSKDR